MEHATAKQLWKLNDLAIKCQEAKPKVSLKRHIKDPFSAIPPTWDLAINLPMSKKEASLHIQRLLLTLAEQEAKL